MATICPFTPYRNLAQSVLLAWSSGDQTRLADSLNRVESFASGRSLSYEEQDVLELVKGIGMKMQDLQTPASQEDLDVSIRLLRHLARVPA
jgi:hypothetical protein